MSSSLQNNLSKKKLLYEILPQKNYVCIFNNFMFIHLGTQKLPQHQEKSISNISYVLLTVNKSL